MSPHSLLAVGVGHNIFWQWGWDIISYVSLLFGKKSRISIFICVLRSFLLHLSQVIRLILLSKHLLEITYVSLCSILCNIFEDRQSYNESMEIMSSTCKCQCIFQKNIQCTWWCITLNNVLRQPQ